MKNKDIKNFSKSQEITREIIHAIEGSITREDAEKLSEFISKNRYSEDLINSLGDENRFVEVHEQLQNTNKNLESFYHKLDNSSSNVRKRSALRIAIASVSVTAAVVFLSVMIYLENNKENNFVARGVDKPMLILSNGDEICLDSTIGDIVSEGSVVSKAGRNTLIYAESLVPAKTILKYNRLVIPHKYNYSIILCDSTEVYLNANTILDYPETFTDSVREVKLDGEAYFKVKKSDIPFLVTVNNVKIRVYGTEFNVNTNTMNNIETTLISGSVGVTSGFGSEILIKPNQMISINKKTSEQIVKDVDIVNHISWRSGYFRYAAFDFVEMVNDIELWYGVKIKIDDKIKKENKLITLSINRDIPIEETFRFIEKLLSVKIINQGGGNYIIE